MEARRALGHIAPSHFHGGDVHITDPQEEYQAALHHPQLHLTLAHSISKTLGSDAEANQAKDIAHEEARKALRKYIAAAQRLGNMASQNTR
jgi:hypothetical protein